MSAKPSSSVGPTDEGRASATRHSLLVRVRAHDGEAWERLIRLYAPLVLHACRQARLPREDAADVFQEVFQAAFTRIETFEKAKAGDTFRGWLLRIARNKVIDIYRRREREPRAEGGTEIQRRLSQVGAPDSFDLEEDEGSKAPAGAGEVEMRLFHRALEEIRTHFHERTWRAFQGTVLDGRSPADVGEELGMSAGAVRVAKSRVLQRLRAELGDLD